MSFPVTLLDLAGSVALLLWGIHMVQTGVQRAFGARLRSFLGNALRNRGKAFLAGIGVTAILQSSTATGLMITGFAASGLVDLVPALAVMLGANVGTTLIVQLLSFNVAEVAPALILIGVLMFRRADAGPRDFGRVLIGLGLVLMALHQFIELLTPYEDVPSLRMLLGAISTQPVLDVILGAGLTWAAHSSVAVVLVVMSFAAQGTVPPDAAFALVLGANLGTAINPVLEGATGNDPAARRLPLGNLINRVIGVAITLVALPYLGDVMVVIDPDKARAVADFHTAFNVVLALVFFPLLTPYAALLRRWLPAKVDQGDPATPLYLDQGARETPVLAIGCAAREALRLADVLESMLQGVRDTLTGGDRRTIAITKQLDDVLDRLNNAIKAYLISLEPDSMTSDDHRRVNDILGFATNLEQAGDIVERNLLGAAGKRLKRGLTFSRDGQEELLGLIDRVMANVRSAASLLMTADQRAARILAEEKEAFRQMEIAAITAHFDRLREGRIDTAETSSLHLDVLRDLKQVNTHLVAAAAYPVLENLGGLLRSRLRQEDDA
jgi:phosphate:Na+ symporter